MQSFPKIFFGLITILFIFNHPVLAHDHVDSPGAATNNILDFYAFDSPTDAANLVLAMTVHSFSGTLTGDLFSDTAAYGFFIDNDNDFQADLAIAFIFSGDTFSMSGLTTTPKTGTVTPFGSPPEILSFSTSQGMVQAFAGPRDDHSFFDLDCFNAFIAAPYVPDAGFCQLPAMPSNFYANLNAAAIVVEVPKVLLSGASLPTQGTLHVWAASFTN